MFNFTTQTVYNSIVKSTIDATHKTVAKGTNLIIDSVSNSKPAVRIGNTRFDSTQIESIYMKAPTQESLASVTFDMADIPFGTGETQAIARIVLYIGLSMNSQDSVYANPFVYKGKPFYVEFKANSSDATKTAEECARVVKKFLLFETDEKLLTVAVNGSEVTISGVNGYQQIRKAVLQKFDPNAIKIDCCTDQGDFIDIVTGVPAVAVTEDETTSYFKINENGEQVALASDEVPISPGLEAFGDYNWIIHNLRLPTAGNTSFWSANKEEMPVPGQSYTQFTITMKDIRDRVAGESVGMRTTSVTTHVLYVAGDPTVSNSPAYLVKNALSGIGTVTTV